MKKQSAKKLSFWGWFWLSLEGFWRHFAVQVSETAVPESDVFFSGKMDHKKDEKKSSPRGSAHHWHTKLPPPEVHWGVGGRHPNTPMLIIQAAYGRAPLRAVWMSWSLDTCCVWFGLLTHTTHPEKLCVLSCTSHGNSTINNKQVGEHTFSGWVGLLKHPTL